ncbi:MAG: TonB-dependent receptor [Chitinophagaceae bacterium]|jgi:hypothetical protein|nr:TonB-dependent receptor [Chitinophagaceae bacterium]
MKKPFLIAIALLFICKSNAQTKVEKDSAAKPDSLAIEEIKDNTLDNLPVISLDDDDFGEVSSSSTSSVLSAAGDPFLSAATYNFSMVRFKIRAYENDANNMYLNGIPVDNLDNGVAPYSLWSGLNNVMRNREVSIGLHTTGFAFGNIGVNTNVDMRAGMQRKQTNLSYSLSNRNYKHNISFVHSTGFNKNGWAFSIAGSRRYADESYIPGTYFDGWSWFGGIDKKIGAKNILSLIAFEALTEYGRQSASVMEAINLSGTNYYNPSWGWQDGKKRNSNVAKQHQPVFILSHNVKFSSKASLNTSAGYSFGERSTSALDWYNAPDPRPDYYRYLPSFWTGTDNAQAAMIEQQIKENPDLLQINWQQLYNINQSQSETINDADGIAGNNVSGIRSHYILSERAIDSRRINAASVLNASLSGKLNLSVGLTYQRQDNHFFQRAKDLLGGDFWVNVNQFAERDFPNNPIANQNDLNIPNRLVRAGEHYGYDYNISLRKASEWTQLYFKWNKVDYFLAGEISYTDFQRTGNVRNGLFPDNSFGVSKLNVFVNYAAKTGFTYKIDGRNYLFINGIIKTQAPFFDQVYLSPRTRDFTQNNITSEKIQSVESGYILNAPGLRLKLTGYYTSFKNGMNVISAYQDQYQTFVNIALNGIGKVHYGGEIGFEANVLPRISLNGAASVGTAYYSTNQQTSVTVDNSSAVLATSVAELKNYHIPSTPQQVYSLGITYRSPKYFFMSITGNGFNNMWLSMNPLRRSQEMIASVTDPALLQSIISQQKFSGNYTLDFFGGYTLRMKHVKIKNRNANLVLYTGANNLLNNKKIISGGYEQMRFDAVNNDVNKFPPKYYYALGFNYFISIAFRI